MTTPTGSDHRREALRQQLLLRVLWRDADSGVLRGHARPLGAHALQAGVAAYRGNAGAVAERALAGTFPTLAELVGDDAAGALARDFWRHHPPARGDLADLLTDPTLEWARGAWCRAVLTDPVRPLAAYEQLTRRFPDLLHLEFAPRGGEVHATSRYAARVPSARAALDVCCDFLAHVRAGVAASDDERATLAEALDASRAARAEADDEGVADQSRGVA